MTRLSQRIAAATLALAALAGCEHAMLEDTIFDKEYIARHMPHEEKVLRDGWFEPRATGSVQSYCYRTIGKVECYPHPLDSEQYRLNGYFGPAPE